MEELELELNCETQDVIDVEELFFCSEKFQNKTTYDIFLDFLKGKKFLEEYGKYPKKVLFLSKNVETEEGKFDVIFSFDRDCDTKKWTINKKIYIIDSERYTQSIIDQNFNTYFPYLKNIYKLNHIILF